MQSLSGWRRLQERGTTYIIKTSCVKNVFKIVMTDFVHIWVKESTEEEILDVFQELNPFIECSEKLIADKIWSLVDTSLEEHQKMSSSFQISLDDENVLQLKFRTGMDGHTFKLHFKLPRENSHVLFKEVTLPLLSMSEELLARQDYLCSLLEKKDVEIAQYKIEGACLQRHSVETQPFVKTDFLAKPCVKASIINHPSGILKIIEAANVLAKPGQDSPRAENDLAYDQPLHSRDQDPEQLLDQTVPLTEDAKSDVSSEVQNAGEKNPGLSVTQTVRQVISVPKKKRTKLNL